VRCLQENFEARIPQLQVPVSYRRVVRTTNLLERLFEEGQHRSKIVPTVAGERSVLKLLYAATIHAPDSWRGICVAELERRQLERLQTRLTERAKQENAPSVTTPPTPQRISRSERTWPHTRARMS
jgi:transposase-like protein